MSGSLRRGVRRRGWGAVTVRIGLIGAGAVGTRHARVLSGFDDVELAVVHDPHRPAAMVLAEQFGAAVSDDVPGLLSSGLDAVWLCVPPGAHGELDLAVVRAGLPLFVEKPLAADLPVAEAVAAAVADAGLPTATGYHWRHLDTVAHARSLLAGTATRLAAARWWSTTPPPLWWSRQDLSGGQVVEQATHVLDVLRVLAGEVAEVSAAAAPSTSEGRDVPDATAAVLRFESGAVGTVSTSCVLPVLTAAGVDLVADGLSLNLTESSLSVRSADGSEEVREPATDPRTAVDRAFVDVLCGRPVSPALVDVGEALRTHRLAWAIRESARTGRPVRSAPR
jgi:myo-inositol 2-dehydrogenase / D-chiro-inositol 1-dehydrogenase